MVRLALGAGLGSARVDAWLQVARAIVVPERLVLVLAGAGQALAIALLISATFLCTGPSCPLRPPPRCRLHGLRWRAPLRSSA